MRPSSALAFSEGAAGPLLGRSGSWRDYAACTAEDPELFFAEGHAASTAVIAQISAAKAVCASCPVRPECLAFAEATGQAYGTWGGVTEQERQDARRPPSPLPALCGSGRHLASLGPRGGCPECAAEGKAAKSRKQGSKGGRDQSGRFAARRARQAEAA
jgi:WhiB family redox-sensing transcriptional regulator